MNWGRFSDAVRDLRKLAAVCENVSFKLELESVADIIEQSQKFYLPDARGVFATREFADFYELFRLPYESISVYAEQEQEKAEQKSRYIAVGVTGFEAEQAEGYWCRVWGVMLCDGVWNLASCGVAVRQHVDGGHQLTPLDTAAWHLLEAEPTLAGSVLKHAQPYVTIISSLCAMLGLKNVAEVPIEPPAALNKKRARTGKLPLWKYHVLRVDGEMWDAAHEGGAGDSGYRSHLRRGHIRRRADGRCVWVRATYVHGKIDGFVAKDYDVKTKANCFCGD